MTFRSRTSSKGKIYFTCNEQLPYYSSYDTMGNFCIGYCVDAPKEVRVRIDTIKWSYLLLLHNTDTTWMFNKVTLKGKTNAFSLAFRNYQFDSANYWFYYESMSQSYPISAKDSIINIKYSQIAKEYKILIGAFTGQDIGIPLIPPIKTTVSEYDYNTNLY